MMTVMKPWTCLGCSAALWLAACAANPPAKTPAETPAAASAKAPAAAPDSEMEDFDTPPDGKWLTDETGRQYFVREIPKAEGQYFKPTPDTVRLGRGETYDLLAEDEHTFKVKVYRVENLPAAPAPATPPPPSPAVVASYRSESGTSDRWQLEDFGRGLPKRGQWREGFAIVDFDGDGNLDIVHGPPRKGGVVPIAFFGDGQGSWRQQPIAVAHSVGYDYGDVAVADFNHDGRLDLALGVHLKGLVVLVATPEGPLQEWSQGLEYSVAGEGTQPASFSSRAIAAVDWNGDGWMDIVALGEGPRLATSQPVAGMKTAAAYGLAIFENHGDGTWKPIFEPGTRAFGDTLDVADIDGDGRPDAALGLSVLGADDLLRYGRAGGVEKGTLAVRVQSYSQAVRLADLNGDGLTDVLVGYLGAEGGVWRHGIDAYVARPDHTFTRRTLFSADGRQGITALAAGDLDGDQRLDVVGLSSEGETLLFRGNDKGFFDREASAKVPALTGCRGFHLEAADLDHDGSAEFVEEFAGESSVMTAVPACPSQGGVRAWKVRLVTRP
jgi:hypothetical protein